MTVRARPTKTKGDKGELSRYVDEGLDCLGVRYAEVRAKLEMARDRLGAISSAEDSQAIGVICRDATILFANAIFSADFVPNGQDITREDEANARIETTLRHFGQLAGSDKLRRLVRASLAYAMRLQHDQEATANQARRTTMYTTLSLIELADLVETATRNHELVQRWGRYKCGGCGSTQIQEEYYADFDGPGPTFLICQKCNWQEVD